MVFYELVYGLVGLLGLWLGSDLAVSSAKKIASRLQISGLIVGLSVASIGTSLPEIFTNLAAAYSTRSGVDASGIAIGNIIGSDLAQITLLLGLVGAISTLHISKRALRRDGSMMLLALSLMFLCCSDGFVSPAEGLFLVFTYVAYLAFLFHQEEIFEKIERKKEKKPLIADLLKSLLGIVVVVYAADLVVSNSVFLAGEMGVKDSLIGLFVGLGTSIPELTVSLKALEKKSGRLSLGNLIGSNITDPLLSFGLGAAVAGVRVSGEVIAFDFVFWFAATLIALLMLFDHMDLNRKESGSLIVLYLLFLYLRVSFF